MGPYRDQHRHTDVDGCTPTRNQIQDLLGRGPTKMIVAEQSLASKQTKMTLSRDRQTTGRKTKFALWPMNCREQARLTSEAMEHSHIAEPSSMCTRVENELPLLKSKRVTPTKIHCEADSNEIVSRVGKEGQRGLTPTARPLLDRLRRTL